MSKIIDIENLSGVSKSTISRYFSGQKIRSENKILIEKAIEQLNYNVKLNIDDKTNCKSNTIGIVIPQITDPFFPSIIRRLEKILRESGYMTLISNYDAVPELEEIQVNNMIKKNVDGIILVSSSNMTSHVIECKKKNIPILLLDREIEGVDCDVVMCDHYQATYDALSMVIRKGHKKIGMLRNQDSIYTDEVRYRAYVDALTNHNIEIKPEYVVRAGQIHHDVSREFMRLMNLSDPITVVFASNIYLGFGVLEGIIQNGIKIPEDVSVITFDRLSSFPFMNFIKSISPEFTSIYQPLDEIAEKTAELLLMRINSTGENFTPKKIIVKTSIIMTESIKSLCSK